MTRGRLLDTRRVRLGVASQPPRRLLALTLLGAAALATAVALAVAGEEAERMGPRSLVQVGGHARADLVRAASTPVIAIDPDDPRRVVLANRVEAPEFSCDVFFSDDGGRRWRRSRVTLPQTGERCYAPSVAFDEGGTVRLLLTMLAERGNEPFGGFVYTSDDGGASFRRPRRVLPAFTYHSSLVAGGEGPARLVWLAGTEFSRHATFGLGPPPNPVVTAPLRDDGHSIGRAREVSAPRGAMVGAPVMALGPNGEVYVLYIDYGEDVFDYYAFPGRYGGHFRLVLGVSRDGGRTFRRHTVERDVVPARTFIVYLPPLPALAVDPDSGTLYAAWGDGRAGSSDVLLRRSRDGGATWTPAHELFADAADEQTPGLSVSPGGRIVAAAYRLARGGSTEVAVRASENGGDTFSKAAAMTPTPFDADIAPRLPNNSPQPQLGSRIGLSSGKGGTLAAWADTRTGTSANGKTDIQLRRVPDELPGAVPLETAPAPPRPRPSRADRRLSGPCRRGSDLDSTRSSFDVVRSFAAALERGQLRRAYRYLDGRWRQGRTPVPAAHPLRRFASTYRGIRCLQVARLDSYDRSEDGRWNTLRGWLAVRRAGRPTRLMLGTFWTHSDTGRPPWSFIGLWTRTLSSR